MSLETHAFLFRKNVPSVKEWQAVIVQLGFDLQIDPELKPFEDSRYVPCLLGQTDSGFEIYYESPDELISIYPNIKERIAPRDYTISFRFGHDMAECACVCIASAALAKSFDAVIYYPDDELFYTIEELISEAEHAMADIYNAASQPDSAPTITTIQREVKRWWEFWK